MNPPAIAALLALSFTSAQAGILITQNLPAGTSIVNINAQTDGAAAFNGSNQALWYQPINGVDLLVQPGTYSFRIIDPTDAGTLYPALTSAQRSSIYTAWTFNSPWVEDYFVFNATARANPNEFQLFDGAAEPGTGQLGTGVYYASPTSAYNGLKTSGYFDNIRLAPPGRAGTAPSDFTDTYTFTVPTNLVFVIPDNVLGDNSGGVSVLVQSTVPEPSTAAFGVLAWAGLLLRRNRNTPGA